MQYTNRVAGRLSNAVKVFLLLLGGLISLPSHAIHLSTFRIYVDQDKREESFVIFSRDGSTQSCNLGIRHYDYDEYGEMTPYQGVDKPKHSALDWIRYSPKRFTLSPTNTQTVRFTLRRKAKAQAAEYRSYLVVDCEEIDPNTSKRLITVKPKLMHNIPIIVRTKKLNAKVGFDNFILKDDELTFDLVRTGDRSVYGDLELINRKNKEIIRSIKGNSIYTETKQKQFSIKTGGLDMKNLTLRFNDLEQYGGTGITEQNVLP